MKNDLVKLLFKGQHMILVSLENLQKNMEVNILKVNKEELLTLLSNGNKGIIEVDGVPHEIALSNNGQLELTGTTWNWGQTTAPSSHQDYEIVTDSIKKEQGSPPPFPVNHESYSFYPSIDDYLDYGN